MLDTQTVADLKAEIASLKGLMLSRRQFPASPSMPKIPAWQIPLKAQPVCSGPPAPHPASSPPPGGSSSSDISPVSQDSNASSPAPQDGLRGPEGLRGPDGADLVNGDGGACGGVGVAVAPQDQVRMEVQGEEEKGEEEGEEEVVVVGAEEEEEGELVIMPTVDRRGGDGQIHEPVDKLRRPEGASNDHEVD
ncbi:peroxisomal membrane protein PEX14 [Gadus morhua]|uniref:peroxisomal membrane protein PEX14 n=1 Tax=Gadus morhua TaxID=8049 RepID=UPI0011B6BBAD|nr:peroxisomal membrane protein PEX14 [Gadus morhua]